MTNNKNKSRSHSRLDSFRFALKGLQTIFSREPNFRIQLLIAALVIPLSIYLGCTNSEIAIVCVCCGLVLVCEAANTIVEEFVDLLHPERSEKAGRIKDMAAAMPLIAAVISVVIAGLVLAPKILFFVRNL